MAVAVAVAVQVPGVVVMPRRMEPRRRPPLWTAAQVHPQHLLGVRTFPGTLLIRALSPRRPHLVLLGSLMLSAAPVVPPKVALAPLSLKALLQLKEHPRPQTVPSPVLLQPVARRQPRREPQSRTGQLLVLVAQHPQHRDPLSRTAEHLQPRGLRPQMVRLPNLVAQQPPRRALRRHRGTRTAPRPRAGRPHVRALNGWRIPLLTEQKTLMERT